MFRYNVLSDLKDGSLVTPLSNNDDGTLLCKKESGETVFLTFDDFDFSKKPEDRRPIIPDPVPQPPKNETVENIIYQMDKDKDDSEYDGTDDTEITPVPPKPEPEEESFEEGFVTDRKSKEINKKAKLKDEKLTYAMWEDTVVLKGEKNDA